MKKKTIALLMAAVLLLGVLVGGTVAWLSATAETVTNTFTVGNIKIKLDEAPVGADGKETTGTRVQANEYKLVPGSVYDKDPLVTVLANSESCYVYVKVAETNNENNIIVWSLNTSNWIPVTGVDNVYVYSTDGQTAAIVPMQAEDKVLESIINDNSITINSNLNQTTVETMDGVVDETKYENAEAVEAAVAAEDALRPKLVFDAYAVQTANIGTDANMADEVEAWSKAFGSTVTP